MDVVRDGVLGVVVLQLRGVVEENLLLLLLQLSVDVFQEILAELVGVNLGKRCSADAFELTFESGMRAYASARSCRELGSEGAFEERALLDGILMLISCSLRALIALILPKSLVKLEVFERSLSPDATALRILDQVVGVVQGCVEACLRDTLEHWYVGLLLRSFEHRVRRRGSDGVGGALRLEDLDANFERLVEVVDEVSMGLNTKIPAVT